VLLSQPDASSEDWARLGEAVLASALEPEEQRQMLAMVKSWPDSLRRAEAIGQGAVDPWWEYGRASGAVDLLRLVRVLAIDVPNWTSLPTNCRWRAGGADEIEELDVRQVGDPDEAGALVAELPSLSRLKLDQARWVWQLEQGRWVWQPPDIRCLEAIFAGLRARLDELGLRGADLGKLGAEFLVQAPQLAELTCLDLALTDLGDAGARVLGSWQCSNLQTLSVRGCKITRGTLAWRGSPLVRNVVELDLSHNLLTARAFEAVVESAPKLARLVLTDSQIEPELLGRAAHASLRELDISRSVVGDWLFQDLVSGLGPKLEMLVAQDCDITDESLSALLVALPRLRLRVLDLSDNSFSEEGKRVLREHAEECGIVITC
jgi:hypothetical protein